MRYSHNMPYLTIFQGIYIVHTLICWGQSSACYCCLSTGWQFFLFLAVFRSFFVGVNLCPEIWTKCRSKSPSNPKQARLDWLQFKHVSLFYIMTSLLAASVSNISVSSDAVSLIISSLLRERLPLTIRSCIISFFTGKTG